MAMKYFTIFCLIGLSYTSTTPLGTTKEIKAPPEGPTSGFQVADEQTELLSIEVLEKHEVSFKNCKAISQK